MLNSRSAPATVTSKWAGLSWLWQTSPSFSRLWGLSKSPCKTRKLILTISPNLRWASSPSFRLRLMSTRSRSSRASTTTSTSQSQPILTHQSWQFQKTYSTVNIAAIWCLISENFRCHQTYFFTINPTITDLKPMNRSFTTSTNSLSKTLESTSSSSKTSSRSLKQ